MWNSIRDSVFTPARIVPIVIATVGAGVTAATGWLAANNFNLDPAIVTGIVVPIALSFAASAFKWQDGWQKYEARGAADQGIIETYDVHPEDLVPDAEDLDSEKAKAHEGTTLRASGPTATTSSGPQGTTDA